MTNRTLRLIRRIAGGVSLGLAPIVILVPIAVTIIFLYLSLQISILAGLGVLAAFVAPVSYYFYKREQESIKALTSAGGWVSKKRKTEE